ncbi:murein hydrolase activator EnvC family protein [Ruminococcus sp.]|jgi:murein DD-endopeptidase MepM/ murein hydrolase activator NlpD|uniref:murein hydrolase activator EnvC family protein n=1 Tax=Ruminococcus sp. TaxID=41978 RepID=UPI003A919915
MKITKRKFKAVLCAILSVCVLTFSVYPVFAAEQESTETVTEETQATTIDPNDIDALESRRQELQAQSDKYQQILEKTKENIADQEEYVNALVSKVKVLDDKIELSHQSINELNGKIQDKQTAIDNANKSIENQMNTLRNRLRNIYMAGNTTDLEIIFGAKSFSDFLDKMELVEALSDYDNNLINSIKGDLENISKEKAELEKDMDSLEAEEASLESDQQELNKILEENKELLAGLYKTSDKATSEIQNGALESDDIEKAISNYYAEKARLEAERAEQERNNNSNSGGSSSGTVHDDLEVSPSGFVWPCPGYYYLTSEWNEDRGSYNHGAIDIADAGIMGADVVAAKEGVVIDSYNGCYHNWGKDGSCGCGGGYGNYVMIAHDGGKMTVYGHLSTTMVYTGQHVYQGQVIGFVGSTGHSTGAHLHFETRLNGVKYNPMTEYQS